MPFPDELARGLAVVPCNPEWPDEFVMLARRVQAAVGSTAVTLDHAGSGPVPGLAAQDCIDIPVRVRTR
jgi:GrpB-like predicted nucleotidyltransferase (UPF0157 family)